MCYRRSGGYHSINTSNRCLYKIVVYRIFQYVKCDLDTVWSALSVASFAIFAIFAGFADFAIFASFANSASFAGVAFFFNLRDFASCLALSDTCRSRVLYNSSFKYTTRGQDQRFLYLLRFLFVFGCTYHEYAPVLLGFK